MLSEIDWVATFTGILAVVAVIQACILRNQIRYFRRIERAYVLVTVKYKPLQRIYEQTGYQGLMDFGADILVENYGKTPAIITNFRAIVRLEKASLPEIYESKIPAGLPLGTEPKQIAAAPARIHDKDLPNITEGNIPVYCCGKVKYDDVFGKEHVTGFCCEYRTISDSPGAEWAITDKYRELNYRK